ncbi:MAG: peptidoglycan-binding protein [Clostridia bacterium]|nr:peptidoglycan-binding protein [Clostridia bacterium]
MKKKLFGRLALAIVLAACLFLTGCYVPPDEISDNTENMTIGSNNLPFQTLAPQVTLTPTPAPTTPPQGQQGGQQGQQGAATTPFVNWDDSWGGQPTNPPTTIPGNNGQGGSITVVTQVPTATPKPVTPTPTSASLKNGSSGAAVRELQQRLKDLGYYTGSVDGDFGTGTENAVRLFQQQNGLTVDGKAGKNTLTKLYSNSAVPYSASQSQGGQSGSQQGGTTVRVTPTPRPTATPNLTNARYLTIGYSGTDVRRLQQRLIDLGYLGGKADGNFGAATREAVKAFQSRMGIWDDGIAGPDTQAKLYSNSAKRASSMSAYSGESLKEGMNGDGVRALQKQLKKLGYYNGSIDGDYGSGTVQAVTAFQRMNGLTADGIAGNATLNKLYSDDAVSAQGTSGNNGNGGYVGGGFSSSISQSAGNNGGNNGGSMGGSMNPVDAVVNSTGYYTLQEGDKSDGVRKLQEALKRLGYYSGTVDGSYGSGTIAAVMSFQQMNNLTVDGKAGPATQRALYGTNTTLTYSTLREYDEGPAVTNLQYTLYELGYYDGEINGVYGATTRDAVRAFQISNHLTPVDGVAGNQTLQKLYSSTAVAATAQNTTYTTVRKGDRGDLVVQLQDALVQLGYLSNVTGEYDNATVAAVRTFQQYNGLAVDGVAGSTTQSKLYTNPVPFPSW